MNIETAYVDLCAITKDLEKQRQHFVDVEAGTDQARSYFQSYFATLSKALTVSAFLTEQGHLLPKDMAVYFDMCARWFDYVGKGVVPGPILDARSPSRAVIGPDEEGDIILATFYRRAAAKAGLPVEGSLIRINDSSPIKTLAAWYKVDKRTIQAWCKRYAEAKSLSFSGGEAGLIAAVQNAGARYQKDGRSSYATFKRAKG